MITFREFLELAESSGPERGRRRLASRGPKKNKYSRRREATLTSDRAALKKAGFHRTRSKDIDPEENETAHSPHHYTNIGTYKNQSDYAVDSAPRKRTGLNKKVTPTSKRVRDLKAIRKQMGGDRTSKRVHDVEIGSDDNIVHIDKGEKKDLIARGRSFKKEVQSVPKSLQRAGAKPGEKVTSTPSGVMPGEDRKEGAKKRDKIYTKALGAKMNPKTGKTMGTMRDT